MKMEQTECSETSAHKIQTSEHNQEESIYHLEQDENWNQENFHGLSQIAVAEFIPF